MKASPPFIINDNYYYYIIISLSHFNENSNFICSIFMKDLSLHCILRKYYINPILLGIAISFFKKLTLYLLV